MRLKNDQPSIQKVLISHRKCATPIAVADPINYESFVCNQIQVSFHTCELPLHIASSM